MGFYGACLMTILISLTINTNNSDTSMLKEFQLQESCFSTSNGTTQQIRDVFIGRCAQFQYASGDSPLCPHKPITCSMLWESFKIGWVGKDPCHLANNAYTSFVTKLPFTIPANKSMFWSGTYDIAHQISSLYDLVTLEDTMLGVLMNGLQWCGSTKSGGINYMSCPSYDPITCANHTQVVFWATASTAFASNAVGDVMVILNGSLSNGAYKNDSFFAKYELPNLNQQKVSRVYIILVHSLDGPYVESCANGTLVTLQDSIMKRGFNWTCVEDPVQTQYLQCASQPSHPSCRKIFPNSSQISMSSKSNKPRRDYLSGFNRML